MISIPLNQTERWKVESEAHREAALHRYRRQVKHLGRVAWQPGDGDGKDLPSTANVWDRAKQKTYFIEYDPVEWGHCWPPRNVLLTDCWVYMAVKLLSPAERAYNWPSDFDRDGDIWPSRVPCGDPPVVLAHGVHCLPVFRYWYVLCGEKLAAYGNWILAKPHRPRGPAWTVRLVCAPAEIVPRDDQNLWERSLFFHNMSNPWDLARKADEDWRAVESHRGTFDRWALRDSDCATILYAMDADAAKNYELLRTADVPGFTVRCNKEHAFSSELLPRGTLMAPTVQSWTSGGPEAVPEVDMSALAPLNQTAGMPASTSHHDMPASSNDDNMAASISENAMPGPSSWHSGASFNISTIDKTDNVVNLTAAEPSLDAMDLTPDNQMCNDQPNTDPRQPGPMSFSRPCVPSPRKKTPGMDRVRQFVQAYSKHLKEAKDKTVQDVAADLQAFFTYLQVTKVRDAKTE